jgi:hypothetical protein
MVDIALYPYTFVRRGVDIIVHVLLEHEEDWTLHPGVFQPELLIHP